MGIIGFNAPSDAERWAVKIKTEKLRDFASDTASVANSSLSSAQDVANKAHSAAFATGKSAQEIVGNAIKRDGPKEAAVRAKELSASVATEAKKLSGRITEKIKKTDANHKELADKVEAVSMGLGITSGIVAAGAALAAPTGLSAVGVALGITSAPLIVTAAPVIAVAATVTGVVSGSAYFYSKWKSKKAKDDSKRE